MPLRQGIESALKTRSLDLVAIASSNPLDAWGVFFKKEDEPDYRGYFYYFRNEVRLHLQQILGDPKSMASKYATELGTRPQELEKALRSNAGYLPLMELVETKTFLKSFLSDPQQYQDFVQNFLYFPPNPFP